MKKSDNMKKTKVIFMGTPEFSVPVLEMLIENYEVILVVTQPDKKVGRHQIISESPVKKVAQKNNIPVFQPEKIKVDYEEIIKHNPDIIITCAYGQIIPKTILDCPKIGCFNVHASLLPKYRGGAPIHKAIINGEKETGVTIMYMDVGMDTGDIIESAKVEITEEDNVGTLHDKLSIVGAMLLKETLPKIIQGTNQREKQEESKVTYAYNIKREEEHLDFSKTGVEIINQIRGLNPWPTANIILEEKEIKVLEAYFRKKEVNQVGMIEEITKESIGITCLDGIIYLTKIKPFGKKIMNVKDYLNGVNQSTLIHQKVK